jgi:hypothetical protein
MNDVTWGIARWSKGDVSRRVEIWVSVADQGGGHPARQPVAGAAPLVRPRDALARAHGPIRPERERFPS